MTPQRWLHMAALAAAMLLAACASYVLMPQGPQQDVRGAFTIDVYRPWNRATSHAPDADKGPVEIWTIDGPGLDQLLMIVGTRSGEPLFRPAQSGGGARDPLPPFRASMSPSEIMELYEASLARLFQTALIEARQPRPAPLGDSPGFSFEYAFSGRDGIEHRGLAHATVRGDALYLVAFHGPRIHHFPAFRDEVERMIASVRFKEPGTRR